MGSESGSNIRSSILKKLLCFQNFCFSSINQEKSFPFFLFLLLPLFLCFFLFLFLFFLLLLLSYSLILLRFGGLPLLPCLKFEKHPQCQGLTIFLADCLSDWLHVPVYSFIHPGSDSISAELISLLPFLINFDSGVVCSHLVYTFYSYVDQSIQQT